MIQRPAIMTSSSLLKGPQFAVILFAVAVYPALAAISPVLRSSIPGIIILSFLVLLCGLVAVLDRSGDLFSPIRIVSAYYVSAFCIGPLLLVDYGWYHVAKISSLFEFASGYALICYLLILMGYALPSIFGGANSAAPNRSPLELTGRFFMMGLAVFSIGTLSYAVLVVRAGGINGLFNSELARGQFFHGIGVFFWGAHFMIPGSILMFASRARRARSLTWLWMAPVLLTFLLFIALQGRMRALIAPAVSLIIGHYLIRPIRLKRLAAIAIGVMIFTTFVGYARSPSVRFELLRNPLSLVSEVAHGFPDYLMTAANADFQRLRSVMLVSDMVPKYMPHDWGSSLIAFLNPVMRILGLEERDAIGPRLFMLAFPEKEGGQSGLLPSMLGEMLVNFPWPLTLGAYVLYGWWLRWIYRHLIENETSRIKITTYAVLILYSANMILHSFTQALFELAIVLIPIGMTIFLAPFFRIQR